MEAKTGDARKDKMFLNVHVKVCTDARSMMQRGC
jgi:hypothetical protein